MISYDIAPDDSADIVGLKVIVFKSQPSSMHSSTVTPDLRHFAVPEFDNLGCLILVRLVKDMMTLIAKKNIPSKELVHRYENWMTLPFI
ncbi:hypothetical protein TNCV_3597431 [Trichonephila clavipes]|nr:hypothetical protein TNCV_3597411 [Trichonephila clavipes]GFX23800.1 hypothetical protein TNCV_3597421 [Trichonephila clavipes]GFX23801.1 hypothetical protein TNCV_3597431 [Trichonephila clavipes]